ncbi:MAG TPA: LysR substrate-binding domain-containing protein [Burkholderiaceae bacterium]|nr:LysR substrate-binding domain-containing protein [Burkholderiaceae bacterium]
MQFGRGGRGVTLHPEQGLRFNDGEAIVQAAVLGLGLAQVPDYMAAAELSAGRLVELLPRHRPPAMPIHAVMPANRLVPPRVRVLLDALQTLADAPPPPAAKAVRRTPRRRTSDRLRAAT